MVQIDPRTEKEKKELRAAKRSKGQTNRNASGVQVDDPDSQSIADLSVPVTQPTATQSPTPPSTLRNNGLTPPTTARSVKLAQRG
jgi:hypothetical protein